jgi:hypothetical protein
MAANTTPIFALTPQLDLARITTATTDKTGATTTNLQTLVIAATDGTKVTQIGFKFVGTSTAGTFLIFISDTDGTTLRLFDEILITAVTSSTTALSARQVNFYSDLQLKSGQRILVGATTVNTNIDVFAQIGDF